VVFDFEGEGLGPCGLVFKEVEDLKAMHLIEVPLNELVQQMIHMIRKIRVFSPTNFRIVGI